MLKEGVRISGRYEVVSRIGVGGMADVYKAIDRVLDRNVAVKVLKSEFRQDALFVKKFHSEAQAAARLGHPNIVNVYDVGEDRGRYYIVMELVEGITLKDYIQKKGQLTPKEVIGITLQVCAGIEAAHNHDIIHRDIKPQNIIISREGKVKVTDFGIAKATSSNTISTNVMGSVHYTSPEQARGGFSDAKSDIYSLGISMYEMITGRLPYDGDSTVSIALKHLQEDMVPPSEYAKEIPYSLERIILKCTQKSPDRRYASISQLVKDLKRSMAEPDGDFVVIAPFMGANTVIITPEELKRIQEQAEYEDDEYIYEEKKPEKKRSTTQKKKSEIDPKMAKIMKILTIVVSVIFVFILLFVGGKAIGIFEFGPGVGLEQHEKGIVPQLEGMTEEEAKEACEEVGLELRVVEREESDKYEEGRVISQKTQEGTKMPEGAVVQVVVSSGLKGKEIEIPELKNMSEKKAVEALKEAGFKEENIIVITREDDKVDAGKVIGTMPEAGSKATEKSEITLILSGGAEKAIMPKLVGRTKEDAEKALEAVGLNGNPKEEYSDKPAGEVIAQSIKSGEEIDKGTTVNYVVSKGEEPPKKVTVPTGLVGGSVENAKSALEGAGLIVEVHDAESTQYAAGLVISVEGEGTQVDPGTKIIVTVSIGAPDTPDNPVNPDNPDTPVNPDNPDTPVEGGNQGTETVPSGE